LLTIIGDHSAFHREDPIMNRTLKTFTLAAALAPLAFGQAVLAQNTGSYSYQQRDTGTATYTECRKSPGTTGLVAGGAAGALVGHGLIGPLIGAIGGAFAGRAIDREATKAERCRVVREEEPRHQELAPANPYGYSDQSDLYADGPSVR
jgi:hypothetical protein